MTRVFDAGCEPDRETARLLGILPPKPKREVPSLTFLRSQAPVHTEKEHVPTYKPGRHSCVMDNHGLDPVTKRGPSGSPVAPSSAYLEKAAMPARYKELTDDSTLPMVIHGGVRVGDYKPTPQQQSASKRYLPDAGVKSGPITDEERETFVSHDLDAIGDALLEATRPASKASTPQAAEQPEQPAEPPRLRTFGAETAEMLDAMFARHFGETYREED